MARPKKEPTAIYPVRHNAKVVARLKKKWGARLQNHIQKEMDRIDQTKKIEETDNN